MKYSKLVNLLLESKSRYMVQLTVPGRAPIYINANQSMVSQPKKREFVNGAFRSEVEAQKTIDAWTLSVKYPLNALFRTKLTPYINEPNLQIKVLSLADSIPKEYRAQTLEKGINKNVKNLYQLIVNYLYPLVQDKEFIITSKHDKRNYTGVINIKQNVQNNKLLRYFSLEEVDAASVLDVTLLLWLCIFGNKYIYSYYEMSKIISKMEKLGIVRYTRDVSSNDIRIADRIKEKVYVLTNRLPPTQNSRDLIVSLLLLFPRQKDLSTIYKYDIQSIIELAIKYKIRLPKVEKLLASEVERFSSEYGKNFHEELIKRYEELLRVLGLTVADSPYLLSIFF